MSACHSEGIRRGCPKNLNFNSFAEFKSWRSRLHLSPPHRTPLRAAPPHQLQPHHHPQRLLRRHLQFRLPQNCVAHVRIKIPPIPKRFHFPFPHILSIHLGHFPKILRLLQHPRFPRPRRPRPQHALQRVKLLLQISPVRPHHHKSRPQHRAQHRLTQHRHHAPWICSQISNASSVKNPSRSLRTSAVTRS